MGPGVRRDDDLRRVDAAKTVPHGGAGARQQHLDIALALKLAIEGEARQREQVLGVILERCLIRFLYGRPLETLLTTFGISLILIQATRTIFGAQNVQVTNPSWMSGGVSVMQNLILPYNRITILGFSLIVVLLAWVVLTKTRLGLFVRRSPAIEPGGPWSSTWS